jgi:hypothetical protein
MPAAAGTKISAPRRKGLLVSALAASAPPAAAAPAAAAPALLARFAGGCRESAQASARIHAPALWREKKQRVLRGSAAWRM